MIYLGADHAGFALKEKIKAYFDSQKIKYQDCGTDSKKGVDASDFALKVGRKVKQNKNNRGILVCGSGIMMSMAANRIKGVRAGLVCNKKIAKQAREHSDINILVLSGKEYVAKDWKKIIDIFLKTKFLKKARYKKRLKKLDKIK